MNRLGENRPTSFSLREGYGMASDLLTLMRKLAPDLSDEMARRAMILERIAVMQPVGRRQLAQCLRLPEREIRNTAALLKDLGYVELNASGMTLTEQAGSIMDAARDFSKAMSGLTDLENRLCAALPVDGVLIAAGDADEEGSVLSDVGRICAGKLRSMLQNGNTLAITGGRSVAAAVRSFQAAAPLNVMVVPARGGLGRSVEWEANTLAEEMAGKLGGHYRLIHLPDQLDSAALQEMLKLPEINEVMELLQRADVILHGVGKAEETMRWRAMSRSVQHRLTEQGARGESFGAYFDLNGNCLMEASGLGVDLARLKPTCRMIAVAAGSSKAEAILAVMRHGHHALLVTDEGAARRMTEMLG